jgi:hypothetical protein
VLNLGDDEKFDVRLKRPIYEIKFSMGNDAISYEHVRCKNAGYKVTRTM